MATELIIRRSQAAESMNGLVELLEQPAIDRLDPGHPLAAGFAAWRRLGRGVLTQRQEAALAELRFYSKLLWDHRADWEPQKAELRDELLAAKSVGPLLFELSVGAHVERTLGEQMRWVRLNAAPEASAPDWIHAERHLAVECHRADRLEKISDYGKTLQRKADQHEGWNGPLVIALGFAGLASAKQLQRMSRDAERYLPWMTRHTEVSAVLVFADYPAGDYANTADGERGLRYRAGQMIEIRNLNANHPLAPNVHLGDGARMFEGRFPGPVTSLAEASAVVRNRRQT